MPVGREASTVTQRVSMPFPRERIEHELAERILTDAADPVHLVAAPREADGHVQFGARHAFREGVHLRQRPALVGDEPRMASPKVTTSMGWVVSESGLRCVEKGE